MDRTKHTQEPRKFDPKDPFYSVSVVVPVHNGEKFIQNTLDCIVSQTVAPFEIVIIDDGSTDSSMDIIDRFADRTVVIRTPNRGASASRNLGAANAKGRWVAFCDQDDFWHPAKLEKQLRLASECPDVHCVLTDYINVYDGAPAARSHLSYAPEDFWKKEEHETGFVVREAIAGKLSVFQPGITSTPIVLREFFLGTGGFDMEVEWGAEDTCFHFRCLSVVPFGVVPEILMYYNRHPDAGSVDTVKQLWRTVEVWEHIIAKYPQAQPYRAELLNGLEALREEANQPERYTKLKRLQRMMRIG
jgi:glycosyltransferase involved in cell wall biosynthesis